MGNTPRGQVFKVRRGNEFLALKVFTEQGYKEERLGTELLKICDGDAMVRLVEYGEYAQLMEYLEYPANINLEALIIDGRDSEACEIVAGLFNKLHAHNALPAAQKFPPLAERFSYLWHEAGRTGMPLLKKAEIIARDLLSQQTDISILHGDLHHNNVMHSASRGYVMIDPKGVIGDRAYDIAYFLTSSTTPHDVNRISAQADILATKTGMSREKLIRYGFAQACLSACWCIEDKEDPEPSLARARIVEPLMEAN